MTAPPNRGGFALLVALLAIVIVTALMLATLLRTNQNAQITHAETLTQRAFAGAETALWEAATGVDIRRLRAEPLGTATVLRTKLGELTTNVTVIKVDTSVVWIVADATVRDGRDQAQHRLGLSATMAVDTTDTRLHPIQERGLVDLF
jgi:Tfp pilus assembly protein PilX